MMGCKCRVLDGLANFVEGKRKQIGEPMFHLHDEQLPQWGFGAGEIKDKYACVEDNDSDVIVGVVVDHFNELDDFLAGA